MHFDPINLWLGFGFGIAGYGAWRYGRQIQSARHMILAVSLMGFSYFTPNVWSTLAVGAVLIILLFWP